MSKLKLGLIWGCFLMFPAIATAQSAQPVVSGKAASSAAKPDLVPQVSSKPSHRSLLSLRDKMNEQDHVRVRSTAATWLGIPAQDQARMTAEEWAEIDRIIDSSNGQIHDRRTSSYMALRSATPQEVAQAGPNGNSCPSARVGGGAGGGVAGRPHRWIRTIRDDVDSCHWAYRSKH